MVPIGKLIVNNGQWQKCGKTAQDLTKKEGDKGLINRTKG